MASAAGPAGPRIVPGADFPKKNALVPSMRSPCKHLPGGAEDREVAMAGMELKLCARYLFGEQLGVLGRDRISASPWWIDVGTWMEPSSKPHGPGEHPQVLSHSPVPAAERFDVVGEERVADAGLLERATVDAW